MKFRAFNFHRTVTTRSKFSKFSKGSKLILELLELRECAPIIGRMLYSKI